MSKRGRKRKLNSLAEIEKVCFLYHETVLSQSAIARRYGVSDQVVRRILAEHGKDYLKRIGR